MTKPIHVFSFNPKDNGGEQLLLSTYISKHGIYEQRLSLQSYGNSATLELSGSFLSPRLLRRLADELETAINSNLDVPHTC
jgi:hypothetical protein